MEQDYKRLVEMLDECVERGSAHINVTVGEQESVSDQSTGCVEGGACCAPTLHKGIDD